MEFDRTNGNLHVNGNGNGNGNGNLNENGNGMICKNWVDWDDHQCNGNVGSDDSSSNPQTRVVSSSSTQSSSSPARYIEHHVTKLDTLAGVAIRYGVEVADIKKMNGLVTDLQMFALKTLHIPLPGRHPPSPCLSNGHTNSGKTRSAQTPPRRNADFFESFQSLRVTPEHRVSPAMSSLRGYYGLGGRQSSEGCEMTVYGKPSSSYHDHEDEELATSSSLMNSPLSHHKRSRSLANGFKNKENDPTGDDKGTNFDKWIGKLSWRRLKSETDFSRTPEKLLKEENGSGGWFTAMTGKGLALRTKAGSRNNLVSEGEAVGVNGFPQNLGDAVIENSSSAVRKSSSTSSLHDQENGSSSVWLTSKWSALKPDLQAALANPIFDGLPKPITGRRVKTALD